MNICLLLIPGSHLVASPKRSDCPESGLIKLPGSLFQLLGSGSSSAWATLPPAMLPKSFSSSEGSSYFERHCLVSPGCSGVPVPAARQSVLFLPSCLQLLSHRHSAACPYFWQGVQTMQHHVFTHSLWQKLCAVPFLLEVSIF